MLSIVVSVRERHDTIEELVRALAGQTSRDFEAIIADCRREPTPLEGPRVLSLPGVSRARSNNLALAEARGDVISFLTDDFIPGPGFVEAHLAFHRGHPDERAVGIGPGLFPPELRRCPFRRWLEDSGSLFGISFTRPPDPFPERFFYVANASLKASLVRAAGSFDERFPYEAWDDFEFSRRLAALGARAELVPGATARHQHRVTLVERQQSLRWAGRSAAILEGIHTGPHEWKTTLRPPGLSRARALAYRMLHWFSGRESHRAASYRHLLAAAFASGYGRRP